MLKIYGPGRSRTFRVFWLCKESGISYEHIPVTINVDGAESKQDWYLKLNPNGRVPTIEDDGFVMWESAAINIWLAEKYKSPIFPKTMEGKGRMLQWAFFIANDVEGPGIKIFHNRFALPPERRQPAIADEAEKSLLVALKILDQHLAEHKHFGLDAWDVTDVVAGGTLYYLDFMKYDLSKFPALKAWMAESFSRPAAKEAIAMRFT
jgi:glutathione S-transferase